MAPGAPGAGGLAAAGPCKRAAELDQPEHHVGHEGHLLRVDVLGKAPPGDAVPAPSLDLPDEVRRRRPEYAPRSKGPERHTRAARLRRAGFGPAAARGEFSPPVA